MSKLEKPSWELKAEKGIDSFYKKFVPKGMGRYIHCGPESQLHGYHILLVMGVFLYGFSIANISYTYINDSMRLLGCLFLAAYFLTGMIIIHVSKLLLNKMTMFLLLWYSSVLWTVASVSLFFFQMTKGYPVMQMVYILIVAIQLLCLLLVILKRNLSPLRVKKIFRVYLILALIWFVPQFVLAIINGDGRWSGPDHISWYENAFGAEWGEISGWFTGVLFVDTFMIAACMWGIIKFSQKWRSLNNEMTVPISGHLLYNPSSFWYSENQWGYLPKGSKDFPDPVTFLREEDGVHYFKRKVFRGEGEELAFHKVEGLEEGIFSCEVVRSNREPEYVKVMYGGKKGKWRPYEFGEIAEDASK